MPHISIFEGLKIALLLATKQHLKTLKVNYETCDVYGYSLYTDDGISSIVPVANSVEMIPVSVNDVSHNYYRYGPQEWSLFEDQGLFDSVNEIIRTIHANSGLSFASRRKGMLDAAFQALVELETEGLFGPRTLSRYVVLWLSDSSDPIMSASAAALNSPATFAAYSTAYNDQAAF